MAETLTINKIAITVHPKNHTAFAFGEKVSAFLEKNEKDVILGRMDEVDFQDRLQQDDFDLLIALGGDGTMLRSGHISGPKDLPILGINLGRFGFLTEINKDEWVKAFEQLIAGDFWIEHRMMLDVIHWRKESKEGAWRALNEAVVGRGEIVRPIHLELFINNRHLTTYVADGIISATPTGSTAYAMAAGGPILSPELKNIVIVPVAPHLSIEQPLVLDNTASVSVIPRTEHKAMLTVDGQRPRYIQSGDKIEISMSDHNVKFIRFQDPGYFYRNLIPYMDQNPSIKKSNG